MTQIYYKSDFCILLDLYDEKGRNVGFPAYDFMLTASAGGRTYKAFRHGERMENLREQEGRIMLICDNHGMFPGRVKVEFSAAVPNSHYPDGFRQWADIVSTDVELTDSSSCSSVGIGKGTLTLPDDDKPGTPGDKPSDTPGNPDTPPSGGGGYEPATDEEVEEILKDLLQ